MDRPRSTCGWKVSWQMLLLTASILSSCFLLTQAQETTGISIRVVPEVLEEGDHVTLTPEGLDLKKFGNCKWYRGAIEERNIIITTFLLTPVSGQINGPAYTGRETGNPDCSLHIADLKPSDSGTYSFNPEGLGVTNKGATNITLSGPVNPSRSLVATIVIIVVLLVLVIAGFLLYRYFFLCIHHKSYGTPTQVISVTPLYENISPAQKVMHNSSSDADQIYESLQHGEQNVYNELIFKQNPSETPSVGSSP